MGRWNLMRGDPFLFCRRHIGKKESTAGDEVFILISWDFIHTEVDKQLQTTKQIKSFNYSHEGGTNVRSNWVKHTAIASISQLATAVVETWIRLLLLLVSTNSNMYLFWLNFIPGLILVSLRAIWLLLFFVPNSLPHITKPPKRENKI